ncbi:MAG TPA: TetR/AcrR family transcriptional regulator [Pseudonocardia sp.]|jgi:AcrR family transcriptional regulator|uniref:TetR/AcrR family transcriptional regulator n=1 Tax=Pseudonocardia sp. TaxID=60912 RepID=UPI002B4B258A|nr:TetR/AcrR family transcriptional regulator [Pseudonocardia sp.]HLU54036.1 TetR/AcrR family transcriptional regulator [Pseudonocardia sp.]
MRTTRAEAKERNRRALLDAARRIVARDGHRARLGEITEQAGLTTGAVYSLFGSKNALLAALVTDHIGRHYDRIERGVPAGLDLQDAVEAVARHHRRIIDDPVALRHLAFEISLQDTALRDPDLQARLATSVRAHQERLTDLFTGRLHRGTPLTAAQAGRLATALRALLVGLVQGVVLGVAEQASEQYVAAAARALTTPEVLGPP